MTARTSTRWSRRRLLLGTGVAGIVIALGLVGLRGAARGDAADASPLIGRPAPDLAGPTVQGGTLDLAALRGNTVIVTVWASWCDPCRQELPVLAAAARVLEPRHVRVVGLDFRDGALPARNLLREVGAISLPAILDANGERGIDWGVIGVPQTFVIDPLGVVRAAHFGAVSGPWIARVVLPLVQS